MCKKPFKYSASEDVSVLVEPHIAVFLVMTPEGPKVPVVERSKNGETFFDLPGGKRDDLDECGYHASGRETFEEVNGTVVVLRSLGKAPHPFKRACFRHFYAAADVMSGPIYNKVPLEHDDVHLMDPEEAIEKLGDRIPQLARNFIRFEAMRLSRTVPVQHLPFPVCA